MTTSQVRCLPSRRTQTQFPSYMPLGFLTYQVRLSMLSRYLRHRGERVRSAISTGHFNLEIDPLDNPSPRVVSALVSPLLNMSLLDLPPSDLPALDVQTPAHPGPARVPTPDDCSTNPACSSLITTRRSKCFPSAQQRPFAQLHRETDHSGTRASQISLNPQFPQCDKPPIGEIPFSTASANVQELRHLVSALASVGMRLASTKV